jgi:hypothetical protein
LFGFSSGGNLSRALRRVGDVATVGEEGPELAVKTSQGTQIVPLRPDDQDSAPSSIPRTLSAVRQNFSGDQQASPDAQSGDGPATGPRTVLTQTSDLPLPGASAAVRSAIDSEYGEPAEAQLPSANTLKLRAAVNSLYGDPNRGMVQNPDYYGQNVDAPVSLNAQGQPVSSESTRPRWADRLDQLATERAATQDALAHPETLPKAHGLKRALPIIAGFLQGAASNPERPLAAGIGGAAAGAVGTAVDPRLATREGLELQQARTEPAYESAVQQRMLGLEAQKAAAEAAAIKQELEAASRAAEATGYVKANQQTGWATEIQPRPQRPAYPQRPTPQMRGGRSGGSVPGATPSSVQAVIDRVRQRNDPLGLFER